MATGENFSREPTWTDYGQGLVDDTTLDAPDPATEEQCTTITVVE